MITLLLSIFLTMSTVSAGDLIPDQGVQIEESVTVEDTTVSSGDAAGSSALSDPEVVAMLSAISEDVDLLVAASIEPTVDAYQVSEYYQNYFKGVLQNMPYTEYLCYAERLYQGSGYSYITHYYLFYDLNIVNGQVVSGSYPCLDVYNQDNVYYLDQTTKEFEGYPTMGFASFAPYSALIDRSFDYQSLYVVLIGVLVFFLIARKTVFS